MSLHVAEPPSVNALTAHSAGDDSDGGFHELNNWDTPSFVLSRDAPSLKTRKTSAFRFDNHT